MTAALIAQLEALTSLAAAEAFKARLLAAFDVMPLAAQELFTQCLEELADLDQAKREITFDALRTATARAEAAERALICAPAECVPECEDPECPYAHRPLTWEQHAKNMEADYFASKARVEALERERDQARATLASPPTSPPKPVQGVLEALKEARGVLSDYIDAAGGKDESDRLMFERFDAAIAKAEATALPLGGWKLVPEEPTPDMLAAFWRQKNTGCQEPGNGGPDRDDYSAYRAMLAVSPSPTGSE